MTFLPPDLTRPLALKDVVSPAILLQVGKHAAPFLVVAEGADCTAIFLDGRFKFRSFKTTGAENWDGLAVEAVEFEVDLYSAFDVSGFGRTPGTITRYEQSLALTAIADDAFGRTIEVPIFQDLRAGAPDKRVAFFSWRAIVRVGDERRTVWECNIPYERDW